MRLWWLSSKIVRGFVAFLIESCQWISCKLIFRKISIFSRHHFNFLPNYTFNATKFLWRHWRVHRWLRSVQRIHCWPHFDCRGNCVIWHLPNRSANRSIWICVVNVNNLPWIYWINRVAHRNWLSFWIMTQKHRHTLMATTWNWHAWNWPLSINKRR